MQYNFGLWDFTLVSSKLKGKVKTNKQTKNRTFGLNPANFQK